METQNLKHPSQRQLAALALGMLAAESRDMLQEHVASCSTCAGFHSDAPQERLEALLRGGTAPTQAVDQSTPGVRGASTLQSKPRSGDADKTPRRPPPDGSRAKEIPQPLREQTKYRLIRLLGRGGMGSVYEASHERMDRQVAIKIISPALVDHPEALKRFDQEVKAAAKLDHPNVAHAYDADEFGTLRVLVMEFVPGESLDRLLSKRGRLTVVGACRIVRQALIGLDHAHARGMVHRDLKPQNLMLTPGGKVKILDFGLAKIASEQKQAQGLTRDNAMMGTPHYLAPEQALDAAKADIRADIYSLGCTLYCLLGGTPPFDGDTEMKVLLAHQTDTPRPLAKVCLDVPRELSDLVDRMLAKDPANRPQTPKEVAEALLPFAKGEASAPAEQATDLLELLAADSPKVVSPAPTRRLVAQAKTRLNPVWLWSGGAAAALLLLLLSAWALGVFTVRTPEGTIVIANVPADADVLVNGNHVTVERNGESVTISAVAKGDHHLKLVQDDKPIWTSDVAMHFAGQQIQVKYEPPPTLPPPEPRVSARPDNVPDVQADAPKHPPVDAGEPAQPDESGASGPPRPASITLADVAHHYAFDGTTKDAVDGADGTIHLDKTSRQVRFLPLDWRGPMAISSDGTRMVRFDAESRTIRQFSLEMRSQARLHGKPEGKESAKAPVEAPIPPRRRREVRRQAGPGIAGGPDASQ